MKLTYLLLLFYSINSFSQTEHSPYIQSQIDLDNKIVSAKKIDSIINVSENSYKTAKVKIIRGISEGSSNISQKIVDDEKKVLFDGVIGSGGFSKYTYEIEDTNELIKIRNNFTMHIDKDTLNVNSERIEVSIYFKNGTPYLSKIIENHYTENEVINSNRYFLNLPKDRSLIDKTHFSNNFQRDLLLYVFKFIDSIEEK